jgi:hypothetical protein
MENKFKTLWRPLIGWVCCCAIAWQFVAAPAIEAFARIFLGWEGQLNTLETAELAGLVATLLGLSTARSFEKVKGVAAPQAEGDYADYTPTIEDEESAIWTK